MYSEVGGHEMHGCPLRTASHGIFQISPFPVEKDFYRLGDMGHTNAAPYMSMFSFADATVVSMASMPLL